MALFCQHLDSHHCCLPLHFLIQTSNFLRHLRHHHLPQNFHFPHLHQTLLDHHHLAHLPMSDACCWVPQCFNSRQIHRYLLTPLAGITYSQSTGTPLGAFREDRRQMSPSRLHECAGLQAPGRSKSRLVCVEGASTLLDAARVDGMWEVKETSPFQAAPPRLFPGSKSHFIL